MFISHYKLANYEVDLNNNQLFQVPLTFANLNSHLLNLFKLFKINTNWSWIRSTCAIGIPETQHDIKCNHKQAQFAATTAFLAGHLQKKNAQQLHVAAASGNNNGSNNNGSNNNDSNTNTKQTIVLSPALKSAPNPLRPPNLLPAFWEHHHPPEAENAAHVPTAEPSPFFVTNSWK